MADKPKNDTEKAAEVVLTTSSDSRFSTVKPLEVDAPDAGPHSQEVRGKPNASKEAV